MNTTISRNVKINLTLKHVFHLKIKAFTFVEILSALISIRENKAKTYLHNN